MRMNREEYSGMEIILAKYQHSTSCTSGVSSGQPPPASRPTLIQSYVESSNVNVVNEMVQMIEVNRAYEANQKTIQAEDSMMSTLWSRVAVKA